MVGLLAGRLRNQFAVDTRPSTAAKAISGLGRSTDLIFIAVAGRAMRCAHAVLECRTRGRLILAVRASGPLDASSVERAEDAFEGASRAGCARSR